MQKSSLKNFFVKNIGDIMEKQTIYGLTRDQLIDWAIENGEKNFVQPKYGIGFTENVSKRLKK